ncbi:hypothetical protein SUGI_0504820 [Cryptomeria japonica]|nr:uncharacterized protein LOC131035112 isoform X2 [Cryptomeria japonica]GLJ26266.1 hypothetical protein SUGI_0504820 [Cryptomeria japonica]
MKMTRPNTQRGRPSNGAVPAEGAYTYGYPADSSYYVVLPPAPYDPAIGRRRRFLGYGALFIFGTIFICVAIYFFWPSQPQIEVVRLNLQNISFQTADKSGSIIPHLYMNISMGMTIKVKNRDYFGLDYDYLRVGIGYRGRAIGVVNSQSGSLSSRGTSYVDATLDLNGIEVLNDVFYLLRDLDRGQLPLDTTTVFHGRVRVLFVKFTLKEVASCEVVVNPTEQVIVAQDCD